jgi:putative FmdB family regulatory protein
VNRELEAADPLLEQQKLLPDTEAAVSATEQLERRALRSVFPSNLAGAEAVPGLPGLSTTSVTDGDSRSLIASACSRPPDPRTNTFMLSHSEQPACQSLERSKPALVSQTGALLVLVGGTHSPHPTRPMPIYDYQCDACGNTFEELVRLGETPNCPACGSSSPRKLMSVPAPPGTSRALVAGARRQAAREGLLSNYSTAERKKLLRGT